MIRMVLVAVSLTLLLAKILRPNRSAPSLNSTFSSHSTTRAQFIRECAEPTTVIVGSERALGLALPASAARRTAYGTPEFVVAS